MRSSAKSTSIELSLAPRSSAASSRCATAGGRRPAARRPAAAASRIGVPFRRRPVPRRRRRDDRARPVSASDGAAGRRGPTASATGRRGPQRGAPGASWNVIDVAPGPRTAARAHAFARCLRAGRLALRPCLLRDPACGAPCSHPAGTWGVHPPGPDGSKKRARDGRAVRVRRRAERACGYLRLVGDLPGEELRCLARARSPSVHNGRGIRARHVMRLRPRPPHGRAARQTHRSPRQ